MISGISHMTFLVEDLDKSTEFWLKIFDAKQVYDSGIKKYSLSAERFFVV
jgi:catechol 2,3-dioxygenase-like lactoylglutathione lyase family enzyme